jgi:hypothetical protein
MEYLMAHNWLNLKQKKESGIELYGIYIVQFATMSGVARPKFCAILQVCISSEPL